MKFQTNQKKTRRPKFRFLPIFFLILFACATVPTKTYDETVSQWKSNEDVAKWMRWHFSYDMARFNEVKRNFSSISVRTAKETFKLKSGVCFDAAQFTKETLNRIDPSYEAQIIYIENRPYETDHFVCSFKKDNKLYIMDYGTYYRSMIGTYGPFNSLEEYKKVYERKHPKVKRVQSISYGWPLRYKDKVVE
jgi:hypothetical protein